MQLFRVRLDGALDFEPSAEPFGAHRDAFLFLDVAVVDRTIEGVIRARSTVPACCSTTDAASDARRSLNDPLRSDASQTRNRTGCRPSVCIPDFPLNA
jgi:hypothetical protein